MFFRSKKRNDAPQPYNTDFSDQFSSDGFNSFQQSSSHNPSSSVFQSSIDSSCSSFDPSDSFSSSDNSVPGFDSWGSNTAPQSPHTPPPNHKDNHHIIRILIIIAAVILLIVVLFAASSSSRPFNQEISLKQDSGAVYTSVSQLSDGNYHLQLSHQLYNLNPNQIYVAGFMMAPEGQNLVVIHEPHYIQKATQYTATAEIIITSPGRYQLSFYSYSLSDPTPSITKTETIEIGSNYSQTPIPNKSAIILVTPSPKPTPKPTPRPTPTPSSKPKAESTNLPVAPKPTSDLFNLYNVNTRYYYHQLTNTQKRIFAQLYDGIADGLSEIPLNPCSKSDFLKVLDVVRYDCPEFFHWDYEESGGVYHSVDDLVVSYTLDSYHYSKNDYRTKLTQIITEIQGILPSYKANQDDFSKQRAIYDYILQETTYDKQFTYCAYADSVYLYGRSKCTGYAHALNLALRCYGIPCAVVIGDTYDNGVLSPTLHMWSVAEIDGAWYHCDATWDDGDDSNIRHAYLNLNDKTMLAARIISSEHDTLLLPQCTSLSSNAAIKEGIYVPASANTESVLCDEMAAALISNTERIQLQFESAASFNTALILLQSGDMMNRIAEKANTNFRSSYIYQADVNYIEIHITPRN